MKPAGARSKRVLIVQQMCKQYRAPLFTRMHAQLAAQGVELRVAYSAPPGGHSARHDDVDLPADYGFRIPSRTLAWGRLVWQFPLDLLIWADLIIVEHAVKHLLNYLLLTLSFLRIRKLGYWTHGGTLRHASSRLLRPLRRHTLLRADWIFAYTTGVARDLVAEGCAPERITALENAIDLASFRAALANIDGERLDQVRQKLGILPQAHVALFCGSLYPGRGVDFLLQAGDRIVQADPSFHLVVIGSGPLDAELREASEHRPWLHVLGSIFGDARAPYFRLAHICLMPYLAGLGILDAMAAGLPFVVTGERATNPEIDYLEDGVTGLVTGDSVERYVQAVVALLSDEARLHAMAEASRRASQQYSIESMASHFVQGIESCLQHPFRAPQAHAQGPNSFSKIPASFLSVAGRHKTNTGTPALTSRSRQQQQQVSEPQQASADNPRLAVLLTCFNRREKTLETLWSLYEQEATVSRTMHVILVDDASRDGTAEAVLAAFPAVELLHGTGSLFWNGGMRMAFARAQEIGFDYYLLLNDDTLLAPHCVDTLLTTARDLAQQGITSIVTASTCDPATGRRTYGGLRREHRWNGVRDTFIVPLPDKPVACDTMNGNCTLIPATVARRLGNLEQGYRQQFGDFDYGFRATRAGFAVHVAPGYLGRCPNNPVAGTWRDDQLPFLRRWNHLMSPKGVPMREWFLFSRRHCGYLWPLYFVSPYLKVSLGRVRAS